LSSDGLSAPTSCGSESETVFGYKQRKIEPKKSVGTISNRALSLKEQAKRRSKAGAAWIRMSVSICMNDGSRLPVSNQKSDSDIQGEGLGSMKLDSQPPMYAEHHDQSSDANKQAPTNDFLESLRAMEICDLLSSRVSCENTSTVACRGDSGSACGDQVYKHRKSYPELTAAFSSSVSATKPEVLLLGGSLKTSLMKRERDTALKSSSPAEKQGGSMKISMMMGGSDLTLVSSSPVPAGISPFSCVYKAKVGTNNMSSMPVLSKKSDVLVATDPSLSQLTGRHHKVKSELLAGECGNPADIMSCCDDAPSVVCATGHAACVD
jgi:hypothetical protein